jgi:hypothetical protein
MSISLPSSGSKSKPRKKPAEASDKIRNHASADYFSILHFFSGI